MYYISKNQSKQKFKIGYLYLTKILQIAIADYDNRFFFSTSNLKKIFQTYQRDYPSKIMYCKPESMQSTRTTMYLNFKVGMVFRNILARTSQILAVYCYVTNRSSYESNEPKLGVNNQQGKTCNQVLFVYNVQSPQFQDTKKAIALEPTQSITQN